MYICLSNIKLHQNGFSTPLKEEQKANQFICLYIPFCMFDLDQFLLAPLHKFWLHFVRAKWLSLRDLKVPPPPKSQFNPCTRCFAIPTAAM